MTAVDAKLVMKKSQEKLISSDLAEIFQEIKECAESGYSSLWWVKATEPTAWNTISRQLEESGFSVKRSPFEVGYDISWA